MSKKRTQPNVLELSIIIEMAQRMLYMAIKDTPVFINLPEDEKGIMMQLCMECCEYGLRNGAAGWALLIVDDVNKGRPSKRKQVQRQLERFIDHLQKSGYEVTKKEEIKA